MRFLIILATTLLLISCSKPKHHLKEFSNGVFEVSYTGKPGEQPIDVMNKVQLLSAYAARDRGCAYYKEYQKGGMPYYLNVKRGFWDVTYKTEISKLYVCSDDSENHQGTLNSDEIIEIHESRYGSLKSL